LLRQGDTEVVTLTSSYLGSKHIRAVIFDLDGTLAPSKSPIAASTARLLMQLLDRVDVCIISGGAFAQFGTQVLPYLSDSRNLARLNLMPTCGTRYYRWVADSWHLIYAEDLPPEVRAHIIAVLSEGASVLGLAGEHTWGPPVEDRGSQITYSALGQQAPLDAKIAWDPDGSKKAQLCRYAAERLPELEVRSGGSTSVDVTNKGIDKAYGIAKLQHYLRLNLDNLLFLGDRLEVEGNDHPVLAMGVTCIPVAGWQDTDSRITDLLAVLGTTTPSGTSAPADPLS
jgi:HAD superfamily hydrolase (TIGR01484 family)